MIIDNIKNYKLYIGLCPGFREAFEFIAGNKFEKIPGKYPIKGDIYYMMQEYESKPEAGVLFEAHRKFIDIQYILSGKERHIYAHLPLLSEKKPYDPEKDAAFYEGRGSGIEMEKGFFAVYFPDDAHIPNLRITDLPEKMTKIVLKIPFAGL